MSDTPTWEALSGLVAFLAILGGAWWRWSGMIGAVKDDLQNHKLHVSETYATKASVAEQTLTLTKAINDVGERVEKRLDGMNDRLDRVIEANHKPVRRSGS